MTFNRRLPFVIVRGIRSQGTGIRARVMTHCSVDRHLSLTAIGANCQATRRRSEKSTTQGRDASIRRSSGTGRTRTFAAPARRPRELSERSLSPSLPHPHEPEAPFTKGVTSTEEQTNANARVDVNLATPASPIWNTLETGHGFGPMSIQTRLKLATPVRDKRSTRGGRIVLDFDTGPT